MTLNTFAQIRNQPAGRYMEMIATVVRGPTVLCAYVFVVWSLAASLDLTRSFPWRAGAFSNWMLWLIIALLLHLIAWVSDRARNVRTALNVDLTVAGDPTLREGANPEVPL
jgi:hypothetical protein